MFNVWKYEKLSKRTKLQHQKQWAMSDAAISKNCVVKVFKKSVIRMINRPPIINIYVNPPPACCIFIYATTFPGFVFTNWNQGHISYSLRFALLMTCHGSRGFFFLFCQWPKCLQLLTHFSKWLGRSNISHWMVGSWKTCKCFYIQWV